MYINIGNRREVLWDDYLVDREKTSARLVNHKPQKKELVCTLDKPWEANHLSYPHFIKLDDTYYMYYISSLPLTEEQKKEYQDETKGTYDKANHFVICVLTSKDFQNWERPNLGFYEFNGTYENNVVLSQKITGTFDEAFDNAFVFVDENPDCPADEKIKALCMCYEFSKPFPDCRELWCYTSPDGLHFKRGWKMMDGSVPNGGIFDSLNVAWYDKDEKIYKCYMRGIHKRFENDEDIRDVRFSESKDFKTWTNPTSLKFGDSIDYPLYTNNVQKYYRAPHMYIGFPTRYVERKVWNKNFEQLGGETNAAVRKELMKKWGPRTGLAVTDSIFMCSRDGENWKRFDGMFMGPGLEHERNWFYGDSSYPMYNLRETPCEFPSKENEISMYMHEGARTGKGAYLYRYTLRLDGFASYHSDFETSVVTTKPFIFEGKELSINFETSAIGSVFVDVLDMDGKLMEQYRSCELFGNAYDRTVWFGESADVSELAGKPVRLRFTMSDADIYSFVFR